MTSTSETAEEKGANVRIPPPLIYVFFLAIGFVLHAFVWPLPLVLPDSLGLGSWPRIVLGSLVCVLGIIGFVLSFAPFKRTGQAPEPWKPTPEIFADGIYRFSRNPMYLSAAVVQTGIGLAVGNLWIVALVPLALIAVHFLAVVREEAYLEEKFGEAYVEFKSSVRRWV